MPLDSVGRSRLLIGEVVAREREDTHAPGTLTEHLERHFGTLAGRVHPYRVPSACREAYEQRLARQRALDTC